MKKTHVNFQWIRTVKKVAHHGSSKLDSPKGNAVQGFFSDFPSRGKVRDIEANGGHNCREKFNGLKEW